MHKIISRYIFKEIAFPFIIILFVLTFVLLMGKILQIMDLIVNKGISIFTIAKLIIFLLPAFMSFTIPIALLIAILIAMGRLSADNEITVLKSFRSQSDSDLLSRRCCFINNLCFNYLHRLFSCTAKQFCH